MKMSFIFVKIYIPMKKSVFFLLILMGTVLLNSCTSARGTTGGACPLTSKLVGYK